MYGFSSFYFFFFIIYFFYAIFAKSCFLRRKSLIIALFLPLFILSALRGETVGGDLVNYLSTFDEATRVRSFESLMGITNTEPGFKIIDYLISCISPSHRGFLVITSFLCLIGPAYLIFKYSKNPILSFLLYFTLGFYTNTFNNVRQSIALSLCFFSIPFAIDRKIGKFVLTVIMASTIHYSSLILLFFYPLNKYIHGLGKFVILLTSGIALFFVARFTLLEIVANSIFVRYNPDSIILEGASGGGWGLFYFYLIILAIELLMYISKKSNNECVTYFCEIFILLQIMAVLLQMYATMWNSMTRATYYFYIPIVVAVPFFLDMVDKKIRGIFTMIVLVLSLLFMKNVFSYNKELNSNSQMVIPYVLLETELW